MEGMKFCGHGIVDKSGKLEPSRVDFHKDTCQAIADYWNDVWPKDSRAPYRVVELFYKDEQP